MPSNEPTSASTDTPQMKDDLTAAAVLRDDSLDRPAGGGGLGSVSGEGGAKPMAAGAAAPNSPVNAALPHDGGEALAEAEARKQAVANDPPEPGHTSQ